MNDPHLLSPVTIGKVTLKNRISSPDASLHLLQGPETFPADGYRAWVIQMAKSCAYLVMSPWSNPTQRTIGMAIVTYDPKDYHEIIQCAWEKYPDFHSIVNATTTEVTEKTVCYTDENGVSHTLEADSVVICGGMKAQRDEALAFYGAVPRFFMTGDCEKVANLQAGNRSAMGKVAQL